MSFKILCGYDWLFAIKVIVKLLSTVGTTNKLIIKIWLEQCWN